MLNAFGKHLIIAGGVAFLCLGLIISRFLGGFFPGKRQDEEKPAIRLNHETIEVAGLAASDLAKLRHAQLPASEWAKFFAVYPGERVPPVLSEIPPMLGSYQVDDALVRFTPRFPLVAGLPYTARFNTALIREKFGSNHSSNVAPIIEVKLLAPKSSPAAPARVAAVYPTADELPANQLKLYILFSAPMSVGRSYEHLHLLDDAGKEMTGAFLQIDQELWDAERRRFTLIFDPGRVKRGLRSNLEDGAPLREGRRYHLVIDQTWLDGEGNRLAEKFEKRFTVARPDRASPDHRQWRLIAPTAGTVEPLRVIINEPLDYALLNQMLSVLNKQGRPVDGNVEIAAGETEWRFRPTVPWTPGSYSLGVDTRLEDRAGNSLRRLYDIDLNRLRTKTSSPEYVSLSFTLVNRQ